MLLCVLSVLQLLSVKLIRSRKACMGALLNGDRLSSYGRISIYDFRICSLIC